MKLKRKSRSKSAPWNKGKMVGQKLPLNLKQIRSIRIRLKQSRQKRELALYNLAIDSNLRACDIVQLRVCDIAKGRHLFSRATITQLAAQYHMRFEITEETRDSVAAWIAQEKFRSDQYLFPSRLRESPHLSTRQYARLVTSWVGSIGLDPGVYGTESLRRTKAALIYRRTKSLLAAQLFLGHTKLEITARFLGIEV